LVNMIVSQLELAGHIKPVAPPAPADRPRVSPPHRI
jgi:shikimate kinase